MRPAFPPNPVEERPARTRVLIFCKQDTLKHLPYRWRELRKWNIICHSIHKRAIQEEEPF